MESQKNLKTFVHYLAPYDKIYIRNYPVFFGVTYKLSWFLVIRGMKNYKKQTNPAIYMARILTGVFIIMMTAIIIILSSST